MRISAFCAGFLAIAWVLYCEGSRCEQTPHKLILGGCFGPEKIILTPPPPKKIPQFAADTLPAPPPLGRHPPPSRGILKKKKNRFSPPPPGSSVSPFPLSEKKKLKNAKPLIGWAIFRLENVKEQRERRKSKAEKGKKQERNENIET